MGEHVEPAAPPSGAAASASPTPEIDSPSPPLDESLRSGSQRDPGGVSRDLEGTDRAAAGALALAVRKISQASSDRFQSSRASCRFRPRCWEKEFGDAEVAVACRCGGVSLDCRGHYSRLKLQSPRGHEGLGARLRRLSGGPERGIGSRAPGHLASHAGAVGRRGAAEKHDLPNTPLRPRLRRSGKRSSSDALFHRKRGRRKHPFACAHAATRLRPAQAR